QGELSAEVFAALPHLLVAPRNTGPGVVDRLLGERGLSRKIALQVPHFLVAPLVVAESDLVVTLPERVARRVEPRLPVCWGVAAGGAGLFEPLLRIGGVAPPLPMPSFEVSQIWHERTAKSPPHRWLREKIAAVAREQSPTR